MHTLIRVMLDAPFALTLDAPGWDGLIRVLRAARLTARLAHALETEGLIDQVPAGPRAHLRSALTRWERERLAVRCEIEALQGALAPIGVPLVLLKGAAYLAQDLPNSRGRLFSDIDIMVPQARLDEVESQLMLSGWHMTPLSAYDQHYYRRWMHELPPMRHRTRGTALDVHHNILPRTARLTVDASPLLAAARPSGIDGVWVLSREDQILHCACHWFFESEHHNGLRDALDFLSLMQHWGGDQLVARAKALNLEQVLGAAIEVSRACFGLRWEGEGCGAAAGWLYRQSLVPQHALTATAASRLARFALYVRGHWLRMPAPLLFAHLARKALSRKKYGTEGMP